MKMYGECTCSYTIVLEGALLRGKSTRYTLYTRMGGPHDRFE
jgi:hypothetical protein